MVQTEELVHRKIDSWGLIWSAVSLIESDTNKYMEGDHLPINMRIKVKLAKLKETEKEDFRGFLHLFLFFKHGPPPMRRLAILI